MNRPRAAVLLLLAVTVAVGAVPTPAGAQVGEPVLAAEIAQVST